MGKAAIVFSWEVNLISSETSSLSLSPDPILSQLPAQLPRTVSKSYKIYLPPPPPAPLEKFWRISLY